MMSELGFTIPKRIFLGFAIVMLVFAIVAAASVVQHQHTATRWSRLRQGYLPIALLVAEAKTSHAVFETLTDRMLQERDSTATHSWLRVARQVRSLTLQRALSAIETARNLTPPPTEQARLEKLDAILTEVSNEFKHSDRDFENVFRKVTEHEDQAAGHQRYMRIRKREREIDRRLRNADRLIQAQLETTSRLAEDQQYRAVWLLIGLSLFGLLLGAGVSLWATRLLSPLSKLQQRVVAVAKGDLATSLQPVRDDEIGRLTSEFERMVVALAARDEQLHEATERMVRSERLAAVGRMAAHVTHEIRNPLSAIGLNVELLEEEIVNAGSEAKNLLKSILRELDRLTGLTQEYLELAGLPQPQLEIEDIVSLTQTIIDFVRPELDAHQIGLTFKVEETIPSIALDEAQYRQAILNLIRNAREAVTTNPEAERTISIKLFTIEGRVVVSIEDNGTGMSKESSKRMFELFYTTKDHGTGLGLPLTQQIVAAHGGKIVCDSQLGRGTTFRLELPLTLDSQVERSADQKKKRGYAQCA